MIFWASADWDVPDWPPLVLEVVTWESCRDNGKLAANSRIQKTIISLYLLPTEEPILANVGTRGPGDFGIPNLLEPKYPAPPAAKRRPIAAKITVPRLSETYWRRYRLFWESRSRAANSARDIMRTSTKIPTSRDWEERFLLVMDPRGHTQDECNVNERSREDNWIRFARVFTRDFAERRDPSSAVPVIIARGCRLLCFVAT